MTALFELAGSRATPTALTRGPWQADAQHGGPPSALLAFLIERVAGDTEWLARLDVELLSPVPLTPLTANVRRHRLSRRVAVVVAELRVATHVVARATGRLLTTSASRPPSPVEAHETRVLPDETAERRAPAWLVDPALTMFHRDAVRYRWESGDFAAAGPAVCWMHLACPVIEGEVPSGQQRIAAVADIASGISAVYTRDDGYGMINSDLDLAFVRPPTGDWFLIEATTRVGPAGTGVCTTMISDLDGVVATGTQTLLGRRLR